MGVTRIWTDAAYHNYTGVGCSGVLIQHEGKFFRYSRKHRIRSPSPREAERRAILHGLEHAKALGAHSVKLYSDSLNNVNQLNNIKNKRSKKMKNVISNFRVVEYHHINRKYNHYADYLARLAWKKEEYEE